MDISSKIKFPVAPAEIDIRFKPNNFWLGVGSAEKFGIRLSNQYGQYIEAGYNSFLQIFFVECRHSSSPEAFVDVPVQFYSLDEVEMLDIRIILDTDSIKLLTMDGMVELTSLYYYSAEFNKIELFAENGKVYVEDLSITQKNINKLTTK
ncbi:MAG: GH32 C-terminal domain-containing protein [Tannerella sp.]|nr:GH32 C-terminal domain-containing protein [Tannerella sp.]